VREVISIDGPSASGKSTVARKVAQRLGWIYVDSGSLYRAVAWKALKDSIDAEDRVAVEGLVGRIDMNFNVTEGAMVFTIDGDDPGEEIRLKKVNDVVSHVAAVPAVRERVVGWLRSMLGLGDLVMEGRDIGTAVFPDAVNKFYLSASAEERARRRHVEMSEKGRGEDLGAVTESLKRRDTIDSTRKVDPLRVPQGAQEIDSTGMSADEVADLIASKVKKH